MMTSLPLTPRNRLLCALPPNVLSRLLPDLHPIALILRETLIAPDTPIEGVYFVESGWVSLVVTMIDGAQVEVGLIGREGMVGRPLVAGASTSFGEAFVQGSGRALRMEAGTFRRALAEEPDLKDLLSRYSEAMHAQTTQTAACNGHHGLGQRLARWLLMAHDRADGDSFQMTQDFLSLMLCVQRSSINIFATGLQEAGAIHYTRGNITVLNRSALEAASCDCYRAVQQRFARLLRSNNYP